MKQKSRRRVPKEFGSLKLYLSSQPNQMLPSNRQHSNFLFYSYRVIISGRFPSILTIFCCGFPLSLQANVGIRVRSVSCGTLPTSLFTTLVTIQLQACEAISDTDTSVTQAIKLSFETFTVLKIMICWVVTPCHFVGRY